jgi:hypothetical protein
MVVALDVAQESDAALSSVMCVCIWVNLYQGETLYGNSCMCAMAIV